MYRTDPAESQERFFKLKKMRSAPSKIKDTPNKGGQAIKLPQTTRANIFTLPIFFEMTLPAPQDTAEAMISKKPKKVALPVLFTATRAIPLNAISAPIICQRFNFSSRNSTASKIVKKA